MTYSRFLIAGLCISVLFHGAGSAFFAEDPDDVSVAASKGGAVSVIGSIEDMVAGSQVDAVEVTEPLEALEPETELLEAVEEPVDNIEVDNTPIATPVRPAEIQTQNVALVAPVAAADAVPVVQGITSIEAVTPNKVITAQKPDEVKPAETPMNEVKKVVQEKTPAATPTAEGIAEAKPVKAAKPTQPTKVAALKKAIEVVQPEQATEVQKQPEALELVTKTPVKKPAPPVKKAEAKKKPKKAERRGGNTNARKGGEKITSTSARSNANGRADAKTNDGGVKAASNYKGKVVAKLRRAKRYPKKAQRKKLTGTARVAFTISRSGSVSGIRISRSSGHEILDQAALEMVKQASPMPKFPGDIQQARMTLQVPVRFDR